MSLPTLAGNSTTGSRSFREFDDQLAVNWTEKEMLTELAYMLSLAVRQIIG